MSLPGSAYGYPIFYTVGPRFAVLCAECASEQEEGEGDFPHKYVEVDGHLLESDEDELCCDACSQRIGGE